MLLFLLCCPLWAVPVRVLVTGDMHGMVLPRRMGQITWGGAAEMLAHWKTHEGYRPDRFLVIANGDIATFGSLYSTLLHGDPVIDAMNAMGYDVCTMGNHEFDVSTEKFQGWQRRAAFPFISANLTANDKPWDVVPPYVIITQNGVKVGVIGLTTLDLNERQGRPAIAQPFAATLRKYVPEMRAKGAQIIIVAAHEYSGELAKIAYEVEDLNIPLWLGAHSHELTSMEAGSGMLVCAGDWFNAYSRIDLDYDPRTGATLVRSVRQELVFSEKPVADKALAARLEAWKKQLPDGRKTAPRITIPRLAAAPAIDGTLDAAEWQQAAKLDAFWIPGTKTPATPATQAWLGTDGFTLYAAFRCANVPGTALKTVATKRDGAVWDDDSIELFLWPDEAKPRFVQFIVNAAGVCFDSDNTFDLASKSQTDFGWNPVYQAKTGAADGAWTLEMAIPLAVTGIEAGKEFRLNITRNIMSGNNRFATWSPLPMGNFHIPPYFGTAAIGK